MRIVSDRLSVRWYVGYDLHEPLPDHSSLTRIRDRFVASACQCSESSSSESYSCVPRRACSGAKRLWGEELYFDATKVDANA